VKLSLPGRRSPMPNLSRAFHVTEPQPQATPAEPVDAVNPLGAAIDWAFYVHGVRQPGDDFLEACDLARAGTGFVWLGLFEPSISQLNGLGGWPMPSKRTWRKSRPTSSPSAASRRWSASTNSSAT
jgi:hypothetical protein